jgi:hypothetical protein
VATEETEEAWLEFARIHKADDLREEARDAVDSKRNLPRKGSSCLLNRRVDLKFRMSRADRELARKALEKKAAELKEMGKTKDGKPTPEGVLLALCREVLESEGSGAPGSSERTRAFCDLVFHICPDCKTHRLITEDGPVLVPTEYVEQFEGSARKVEIRLEEELVRGEALPPGETAGEVPAEVERKVLALYGRSCARCGRKLGVQIHHVIFRSRGGSNEVSNLLCLCSECHRGVHDRILEVFQDSLGNLYWRTKAEKLAVLLEKEVKELAAILSVVVVAEKVKEQPTPPPAPTAAVQHEAEGAARVLEAIGYRRREARERVARALALLKDLGRPPTGDEILNTAIQERALGPGLENSARAESGSPAARRLPGP